MKTLEEKQEEPTLLQTKVNKNLPKPQLIRDSIIKTLPELKEQIRTFSDEELYQLYLDFRENGRSAYRSNNPVVLEMINDILEAYPAIKHKLSDYSEAEIEKIYNSIKLSPNSFGVGKKGTESAPISIDSASQVHSEISNSYRIDEMRREMRTNVPEETDLINQLSDIEIEMLYCEPNQSQLAENHKPCHVNPTPGQTIVPQSQIWSMEHPPSGQSIRARTYLMIHTEFQGAGQPRKLLKSDHNQTSCSCPCCKSKTMESTLSQLISFMSSQPQ